MSANQKNRLKKIQDKVSPPIYKSIEDILTQIDLEKNMNSLTKEENRLLEQLWNTPEDPDLVKRINRLGATQIDPQGTKNDQK